MDYDLDSPVQNAENIDTANAKKETILDRISKRNKDRQNVNDVKLEQRNKEHVVLEGVDYFAKSFAERVRDIDARIVSVSETDTTSNAGDQKSILLHHFADITMEIQELQRYLTQSTMFLSDYKIKACQNVLQELTGRCEETRTKLLPKKKFGFSGKKAVVANKPPLKVKIDMVDNIAKILAPSKAFTWTLSNRTNEYIRLPAEEINGQDVTISNIRNCFVELEGHPGSVQISKASDCYILSGPIARSMFAENCESTTMAVACQQLRLHSSTKCRIFLHVTCRAIIEDCQQIDIADYNNDYPDIGDHFQKAGLDVALNNYTDVADFNWLSPDVPSPNWKLQENCPASYWNELRSKYQEKHLVNGE